MERKNFFLEKKTSAIPIISGELSLIKISSSFFSERQCTFVYININCLFASFKKNPDNVKTDFLYVQEASMIRTRWSNLWLVMTPGKVVSSNVIFTIVDCS